MSALLSQMEFNSVSEPEWERSAEIESEKMEGICHSNADRKGHVLEEAGSKGRCACAACSIYQRDFAVKNELLVGQ